MRKLCDIKMDINKEIKVVKKDGTIERFNPDKINKAIDKSADRVSVSLSEAERRAIHGEISVSLMLLEHGEYVTVGKLHDYVLNALSKVNARVYESYKSYRDYKTRFSQSFSKAAEFANKVVYSGDKENANKDSSLNSTKQALIGEGYMKELMRNFEMDKRWIQAHDEGFIHIHDLGSRYLNQINCCLFDMANLLSGGFEMNGVKYTEPKNIRSAWNVIGDVTLNASSQQYGGFTISEIDTILSKYAKKTFNAYLNKYSAIISNYEEASKLAKADTMYDIRQGYQGFEHKLNTVSNALGQTPFVTITFGHDNDKWSREISRAILEERKKGMGKDCVTAIFPKLVFLYSYENHSVVSDTNNHDLFDLAIECSRTRLYPDYLSLDSPETNIVGEVYKETGKIISPMGCRAYLSRDNIHKPSEEVYVGRNNIGAVSLNIPKMAILSVEKGSDKESAMAYLKDYIYQYAQYVWSIHLEAYEKIGKMKGSTNPLLFVEGGSWKSVGYDEPVAPILELSTASLGYVGLEEAANMFIHVYGDVDKEEFKYEIVKYLAKLVDIAKKKYNKLFALYATPAENLVYRFQKMNREEFGIIKGVTDKEYMTNSFHVHVAEEINAIDKIFVESKYHQLSAGGRITYTEFPYAVDSNVLKQSIEFAMKQGLYYGVNVVSSSCDDCGHKGDFSVCPVCESRNVTMIERVCGYLTLAQTKGDTRLNKGKLAETHDRVKHVYV